MCGRYYLSAPLAAYLNKLTALPLYYGVFMPTKACLIYDGNYRLLTWGLKRKSLIINARLETLKEKSSFRSLKRCLVLASGFYEKGHYFYGESEPLYLAALCDQECFVIITTAANASMAPYHNRMPLIIEESNCQEWLKQGQLNPSPTLRNDQPTLF